MDATRPAAPPAAPWIVLLSLWPGTETGVAAGATTSSTTGATVGWHARIVLPDARRCEFDSPFELAQFPSRAPRPRAGPGQGSGGLR